MDMEQLKQKAIQQYLAKPASSGYACGCMGPQPIYDFKKEKSAYEVELVNKEQRMSFIINVHKSFNLSLEDAKKKVDNKDVGFDNPYSCKSFKEKCQNEGFETKVIKNPSGLYPECPCGMRNVEEVEGFFIKVNEIRTTEGIKLDAILLGPVGGPYENTNRQYEF